MTAHQKWLAWPQIGEETYVRLEFSVCANGATLYKSTATENDNQFRRLLYSVSADQWRPVVKVKTGPESIPHHIKESATAYNSFGYEPLDLFMLGFVIVNASLYRIPRLSPSTTAKLAPR